MTFGNSAALLRRVERLENQSAAGEAQPLVIIGEPTQHQQRLIALGLGYEAVTLPDNGRGMQIGLDDE